MRASPFLFLLPLAACEGEPENIQQKAENLSRALENRAAEIAAEADNEVDAAVAPLDAEANALLNRLDSPAPGNASVDAASAERP